VSAVAVAEPSTLEDAGEDEAVRDVLRRWAYGRDQGKWQQLAACYHPEATMAISWYSGPATGFIERSRALTEARGPGDNTKHLLGNAVVERRGLRAVAESDSTVIVRASLDGVAADTTAFIRFLDRLEKRDGAWRIVARTGIYEHDRVDPVAPDPRWPAVYAKFDFSDLPESCKHLGASMRLRGRSLAPDIVGRNSDDESALKAAAAQWLAEEPRAT